MRDDARFRAKYGPWAVVAGASEGLGAEFARQLAARGLHVALVARRPQPLQERAAALATVYGVETLPIPLDLAAPDVWPRLCAALGDRDVGLLVYNAAASLVGPFLGQPLEDKLRIVDTNCRTPIVLCHALGERLAARGRGGLLLVTSLAGRQGTALVATYGASKGFQLVLGEALWDELRESGVDVVAACAGATDTPGYQASRPRPGTFASRAMAPEPVVREALAALGRGPSMVAGRANRATAFLLGRLLPRAAAVRLMGRGTRALYGG
jgi:hypothetical protein